LGFAPFSATITRRDRQASTLTSNPSTGFRNLSTGHARSDSRVYSTPQALLGSGPSEYYIGPIADRLQPACSHAVTHPTWFPSWGCLQLPAAGPAGPYPLRISITTWTLAALRQPAPILGFGRPRNLAPDPMRLRRHPVSPGRRDGTSPGLLSFRVSLTGDPGCYTAPSWGSTPPGFFCHRRWHFHMNTEGRPSWNFCLLTWTSS
jgi:hypothetical protein